MLFYFSISRFFILILHDFAPSRGAKSGDSKNRLHGDFSMSKYALHGHISAFFEIWAYTTQISKTKCTLHEYISTTKSGSARPRFHDRKIAYPAIFRPRNRGLHDLDFELSILTLSNFDSATASILSTFRYKNRLKYLS